MPPEIPRRPAHSVEGLCMLHLTVLALRCCCCCCCCCCYKKSLLRALKASGEAPDFVFTWYVALQNLNKASTECQKLLVVHLTVHIYDATADTFRQLPDMPTECLDQIIEANAALQAIATGISTLHSACVWTSMAS